MAIKGSSGVRSLPKGLEALADLALDLSWTWSHRHDQLWNIIDPDFWSRTENPYSLLQNLSDERLHALGADPQFTSRLDALLLARDVYLQQPTWWSTQETTEALSGVAYFSMEFGLSEALPLYAGGLGMLAGDVLKTASDLGVPVTGIGLFYREGYFRQELNSEGWQQSISAHNDPLQLPIDAVHAAHGEPLTISVQLPGREVRLRVWKAQVGRVSLYLLDSNDPWNSADDRGITGELYGGGPEQRLKQEIILGIGGWRLIEALDIPIDVCHLNEGHAAFAALERARTFSLRHGIDFWQALWATRAGNVFSTHTAVPAGFDSFPLELIDHYGREFADSCGVVAGDLVGLGSGGPAGSFNMAFLAARTCANISGVSALHGEVSRRIFAPLYPRWPIDQVPVSHVTNGVHVPSWDSVGADEIWTQTCGAERWRESTDDLCEIVSEQADEALWTLRGAERVALVHYARERLVRQLGRHGATAESIEMARSALDPNALTLGFARRFTAYKRPNLLLSNPERFARLLEDLDRPVQIVVAGKAHPDDDSGKRAIQEWHRFSRRAGLQNRVIFLEDYDISLAAKMVQGVDLWINTPLRPWEACGTSGMKVLVNGGLNLSVLDGWWAEAYSPDTGWAIGGSGSAPETDADTLMDLLEQEIVSLFYERDTSGMPRAWINRIRTSMSRLTPQFSANRMLRDYIAQLYRPAAAALRLRDPQHSRLAIELREWELHLSHHWAGIHFGSATVTDDEDLWHFRIPVYLGDIGAESVDVQLYADRSDERAGPVCQSMKQIQAIPGAINGYTYEIHIPKLGLTSDFTPRVVPSHSTVRVPQELSLIRWP